MSQFSLIQTQEFPIPVKTSKFTNLTTSSKLELLDVGLLEKSKLYNKESNDPKEVMVSRAVAKMAELLLDIEVMIIIFF